MQLIGFGHHCSSVCSSPRRFFGQVHLARSHIACIALAGFGSYVCFRLVLPLQMLSLLTGPADSSRGRAQAAGLRFSAGSPQLYPRRHPARLTSRSSRPRVVAAATCYTLRLHVPAAPPQGGLTPALGGRKAFDCCAFKCSLPPASVDTALRSGGRHVASSVKSVWRAHTLHALRWLASETVTGVASSTTTDTVASETSG